MGYVEKQLIPIILNDTILQFYLYTGNLFNYNILSKKLYINKNNKINKGQASAYLSSVTTKKNT